MGDEVSFAGVPRAPFGHLPLGNPLFPLLLEFRFLASEKRVTDQSWFQIRHSGLLYSKNNTLAVALLGCRLRFRHGI